MKKLRFLTHCLVACVAAAPFGCRENSARTGDHESSGLVIAREHLDHLLPSHKPHDFPDAVAEIRRRDSILREELSEGHEDHFAEELSELLDILSWLPAIAADSEIRKPEWESVRTGARDLTAIYEAAQRPEEREKFLESDDQRQVIDSILNQMETLVEKYPKGFEPVFGHRPGDSDDAHHDHHHHHH